MSAAKRTRMENNIGINYVYLIILGILFSYPLFRQGLWFDYHWNPYQVVVAVCAVAFFIYTKPKTAAVSLAAIDYSAIAFTVIYILSLFAAVDVFSAVGTALQIITYLMLFALVAYSMSTTKEVEVLLMIFYWAGIAVVLISLGGAFANNEKAFFGERLFSILEYPNAFAGYVITILLLGLYLGEKGSNVYWKMVYAFANYSCLVGFFGAKSRGAFLTLIVVFLIYIIGPTNFRLRIIVKTFLFAVCSYLFIDTFFIPPLKQGAFYYWAMMLGFALPGILSVFIEKIEPYYKDISKAKLGIAVAVIIGLAGIVMGLKMDFLQSRFLNLSLSAGGVTERFVFYQDALKIVKDNLLMGTGGNGWESLYKQYQGYGYITKEIHNQYLEVWVEAGTLGLLAFIAIWISAIAVGIRLIRKGPEAERHLTWTVLCAALALGIHSFTDFNLSIPALMILLWGLFGCLRALQKIEKIQDPLVSRFSVNVRIGRYLTISAAGIMLVFSVVQVTAQNYGDQGIADFGANDFVTARNNLETAVKLNPLASPYWSALGENLMFISDSENDPELVNMGLEYVDKAIRLDPGNPNFYLIKGKGLLVADRIDEAVEQFEKANSLAPWEQEYADRLAETYAAVGEYYYLNGDKEKAREYLGKAAEYPEVVTKKAESMDPRYKPLQRNIGQGLRATRDIIQNAEKARKILSEL
ncbi:MAG: O-antigen ligase family protein [Thermincola sp.]|jgi:tetratricopeptide (TPR) repeat protein|nr:O-antigen ligase family protein [Thermincola sp.]MDT3703479.1 O-antigen ligase family protein [Thermincola sp.]